MSIVTLYSSGIAQEVKYLKGRIKTRHEDKKGENKGGGARVGGNQRNFFLVPVSLGPISNQLVFVGLAAALFEEGIDPILGSSQI